MICSLNEVEAHCRKAARGAGMPWGVADDIGRAARWLAAFDLDGLTTLAAHLERIHGNPTVDSAPSGLGADIWRAKADTMDPLLCGMALADAAHRLNENRGLQLQNLASPLLILPFVAQAASWFENPITIEWNGTHIATDGQGIAVSKAQTMTTQSVDLVKIEMSREAADWTKPNQRANVDPTTWAMLDKLAQKTYAPATEESRRLGAG